MIIVEGQTEGSFIENVLAPFLWPRDTLQIPVILGIPGHKGGNVKYSRVGKNVLLQLKQSRTAYCSTLLDLYGLGTDFPGLPVPFHLSGIQKAEQIERAVLEDMAAKNPQLRADLRFIPYIQAHEFEGLLFSNPDAFAKALGRASLAQPLRDNRNSFPTPEDVNDDPISAPSKRILTLYLAYEKVIDGTQAATAIGLDQMRSECPHSSNWVSQLESFSPLT